MKSNRKGLFDTIESILKRNDPVGIECRNSDTLLYREVNRLINPTLMRKDEHGRYWYRAEECISRDDIKRERAKVQELDRLSGKNEVQPSREVMIKRLGRAEVEKFDALARKNVIAKDPRGREYVATKGGFKPTKAQIKYFNDFRWGS